MSRALDNTPGDTLRSAAARTSKAEETKAFVLLSVVMAPVLAVIVVSGYGFLVWMIQLIAGPPGPRI